MCKIRHLNTTNLDNYARSINRLLDAVDNGRLIMPDSTRIKYERTLQRATDEIKGRRG